MKNIVKYILQKILGLNNYLYLFARFMIYKLPWDKKEKDFLRFLGLIQDKGHILDIGANIGVMTYHFSKKFPDSFIHSFEPVPENLKILNRMINRYKLSNVSIYPYALGDKNSMVNIIMPKNQNVYFHGLSHIDENNKNEKGKKYHVEMRRLDDIKALKNKKIVALKIDVEDYEYHVLKGAEQMINENRPVIYCELWDSENREKCLSLINELNYGVFIHQNAKLDRYSGQKELHNFFFIPTERCNNLNLY
ncbi:MAG: FkbM family methyltransferase [Bacteroidales bacterium]